MQACNLTSHITKAQHFYPRASRVHGMGAGRKPDGALPQRINARTTPTDRIISSVITKCAAHSCKNTSLCATSGNQGRPLCYVIVDGQVKRAQINVRANKQRMQRHHKMEERDCILEFRSQELCGRTRRNRQRQWKRRDMGIKKRRKSKGKEGGQAGGCTSALAPSAHHW